MKHFQFAGDAGNASGVRRQAVRRSILRVGAMQRPTRRRMWLRLCPPGDPRDAETNFRGVGFWFEFAWEAVVSEVKARAAPAAR